MTQNKTTAMKRKAVAIAKDVLKRLQLRKLHSTQGCYLGEIPGKELDVALDDDAKKHIDEFEKKCVVCALGAAFLSYIRLYDGLTCDVVQYGARSSMVGSLKEAFTELELDQIESCYEKWRGHFYSHYPNSDEADPTEDWIEKNYNRTNNQRLKLLMQNVVENNGDLKL